jgi:hypothetical protein
MYESAFIHSALSKNLEDLKSLKSLRLLNCTVEEQPSCAYYFATLEYLEIAVDRVTERNLLPASYQLPKLKSLRFDQRVADGLWSSVIRSLDSMPHMKRPDITFKYLKQRGSSERYDPSLSLMERAHSWILSFVGLGDSLVDYPELRDLHVSLPVLVGNIPHEGINLASILPSKLERLFITDDFMWYHKCQWTWERSFEVLSALLVSRFPLRELVLVVTKGNYNKQVINSLKAVPGKNIHLSIQMRPQSTS